MGLKTAFEHNPVLLMALLLFGGWLAVTAGSVVESIGDASRGMWVGPNGVGGVMGLTVLLALGVLLVYLYAELAESDPAPESFPPER